MATTNTQPANYHNTNEIRHNQNCNRLIMLAIILSILFTSYLLFNLPIGIKGEWTWAYAPNPPWIALLQVTPVILVFALIVFFAFRNSLRLSHKGNLILLAVMTLSFLSVSASTVLLRQFKRYELYYIMNAPGTTGAYLDESRKIKNIRQYLRDYEKTMMQPVSKARTTHLMSSPPGMAILLHILIAPLRYDRNLALRLGRFWDPQENYGPVSTKCLRHGQLKIWWLISADVMVTSTALFILFSLAFIPCYAIACEIIGKQTATIITALAMLVPACHIFNPGKDTAPLVFIFGMWYMALRAARTRSNLWAAVAGMMFFAGIFITFMCIPAAGLILLVVLFQILKQEHPRAYLYRHAATILKLSGWGCLTFAAMGGLLYAWSHYSLPHVVLQALSGQKAFYHDHPRTYVRWVVANPLEWFLLGGSVMSSMIVMAAHNQIIALRQSGRKMLDPYFWSTVLLIVLLDIFGIPKSEAGRLWVFMMPITIICSARACSLHKQHATSFWAAMLTLSAVQFMLYHLLLDVWEASYRIGNGLLFG